MDAAATRRFALLRFDKRARWVAWTAELALLAIGMLLVGRRAAGALVVALPAPPLLVTLVIAAATVALCRIGWQRCAHDVSLREQGAFGWTGSAALWALWLGCAPPSVHAATWLLGLPLVVADHISRQRFLHRPATAPTARSQTPPMLQTRPEDEAIDEGEPAGAEVVQSMTRTRSADGVETIRGLLRADFALGQRHATLHVGFCPPLERLPLIEVEIVDGPDATVKVVQALAHGARLEIRLAEPADEPCHLVVDFSATPSALAGIVAMPRPAAPTNPRHRNDAG